MSSELPTVRSERQLRAILKMRISRKRRSSWTAVALAPRRVVKASSPTPIRTTTPSKRSKGSAQ